MKSRRSRRGPQSPPRRGFLLHEPRLARRVGAPGGTNTCLACRGFVLSLVSILHPPMAEISKGYESRDVEKKWYAAWQAAQAFAGKVSPDREP